MPVAVATIYNPKRASLSLAKDSPRPGSNVYVFDPQVNPQDVIAWVHVTGPSSWSFQGDPNRFWDNPRTVDVQFEDGRVVSFSKNDKVVSLTVTGGSKNPPQARMKARSGSAARAVAKRPAASPLRARTVFRSAYGQGLDAVVGDFPIGSPAMYYNPPRYRGAFDNLLTYEVGDRVYHAGRYWGARERITPPWFPMFSSGEVPGVSDAWFPADPPAPQQFAAPSTVFGAAQSYTDSFTVKRVQQAIMALPQTKTDADLQAVAKSGGADGVFGPGTKRAVGKFNRVYMGNPDDGENITDRTLAGLRLTTPIESTPPAPPVPRPPMAREVPRSTAIVPAAPAAVVTAPGLGFLKRDVVPGVPAWQALLGGLGALGVGYGTYRLARGRKG